MRPDDEIDDTIKAETQALRLYERLMNCGALPSITSNAESLTCGSGDEVPVLNLKLNILISYSKNILILSPVL